MAGQGGVIGTILGWVGYQLGMRTDTASATGSLHGKIGQLKIDLCRASLIPPFVAPLLGSGLLGNVIISSNTTLNEKEMYQYQNLTVNQGITLTAHRAIILVKDTLTINGLISATGKGATGGNRPAGSGNDGFGFAGGGGGGEYWGTPGGGMGGSTTYRAGGAGGLDGSGNDYNAKPGSGFVNIPAAIWSSPEYILEASGAGGGVGSTAGDSSYSVAGRGGGNIIILARKIIIGFTGAIRADGTDGTGAYGVGASGGGGGGLVYIFAADSLSNSGLISAAGGSGGENYSGGGRKAGDGGNGCIIKVVQSEWL